MGALQYLAKSWRRRSTASCGSLVVAVTAVLGLAACTQPFYDPSLVQATGLTRDWTSLGSLQVVDAADVFLPAGFFYTTWYPRSLDAGSSEGILVFSDESSVLRLLVSDQASVRIGDSGTTTTFVDGLDSGTTMRRVFPFYSGGAGLPDRYVTVLTGPSWPADEALIIAGFDGAPPDTPFLADFGLLVSLNTTVQLNEDSGAPLPTDPLDLEVIGFGGMQWGVDDESGEPQLSIPIMTRNADDADPVRVNEVYEGLLRLNPDGTSGYVELNHRNSYLDLLEPDAGGNPSGVIIEDSIRYVVDPGNRRSFLSASFFPVDSVTGEADFQARDERILYWDHSGPDGPGGADTPVRGIAVGSRIEAVLPDGSVIISEPDEGLWYRFLPEDRSVSDPLRAPGLEIVGQFPTQGAADVRYLVQQTISASQGADIVALAVRSYLVSGEDLIAAFAE